MNINRSHWLMGLSAAVLLTAASSCVDNAYDLSDIDTTSRFNAKDLVIPMNIDQITLDQVLDLDDDSEVKTIVQNGKKIYAVQKDGTFKSDPIKVSAFTTTKPTINPITSTLDLVHLPGLPSVTIPEGTVLPEVEVTGYYDISCSPTSFRSDADNVDKSIKSIGYLGVETKISNEIKVVGFSADEMKNIKIEGLVVQYPKGLDATTNKGKYDKQTGKLAFSEALVPNAKGIITLEMTVKGIDPEVANIVFDASKHHFSFSDNINVTAGKVNLYMRSNTLPNQITFKVTPSIDPIKVKDFTGKIEYEVEEFNIAPIDINNIPDFLSQKGTKVTVVNPQLYLKMNNPLDGFIKDNAPMKISSGLVLTSEKNGKKVVNPLDNERFTTDVDVNTNNTFVFSPTKPAGTVDGFVNPQHVAFTKLSNVLDAAGEGIPTKISVDVSDPRIPETEVVKLQLGSTLPEVEGDYTFFAPLQLGDNSLIAYTDTLDGWSDDDLDKMTLTKVNVNFDCSTEVPFDIVLSVEAIDKSGNVIPGAKSNEAMVPAKSNGKNIDLTVNAVINKIDGMLIRAKVTNKGSNTVLTPEMKLDVKNFRAKASGYYEEEL